MRITVSPKELIFVRNIAVVCIIYLASPFSNCFCGVPLWWVASGTLPIFIMFLHLQVELQNSWLVEFSATQCSTTQKMPSSFGSSSLLSGSVAQWMLRSSMSPQQVLQSNRRRPKTSRRFHALSTCNIIVPPRLDWYHHWRHPSWPHICKFHHAAFLTSLDDYLNTANVQAQDEIASQGPFKGIRVGRILSGSATHRFDSDTSIHDSVIWYLWVTVLGWAMINSCPP